MNKYSSSWFFPAASSYRNNFSLFRFHSFTHESRSQFRKQDLSCIFPILLQQDRIPYGRFQARKSVRIMLTIPAIWSLRYLERSSVSLGFAQPWTSLQERSKSFWIFAWVLSQSFNSYTLIPAVILYLLEKFSRQSSSLRSMACDVQDLQIRQHRTSLRSGQFSGRMWVNECQFFI